jgi:hypothetical protein
VACVAGRHLGALLQKHPERGLGTEGSRVRLVGSQGQRASVRVALSRISPRCKLRARQSRGVGTARCAHRFRRYGEHILFQQLAKLVARRRSVLESFAAAPRSCLGRRRESSRMRSIASSATRGGPVGFRARVPIRGTRAESEHAGQSPLPPSSSTCLQQQARKKDSGLEQRSNVPWRSPNPICRRSTLGRPKWREKRQEQQKCCSRTGARTLVPWMKTKYPNH